MTAKTEGTTASAPKPSSRPLPKPPTPARLEKAAYAYLERYSASGESLRRVLMRRVERGARLHHIDRAEAAGWVSKIVAAFQDRGLLDDRRYAEGRARSMLRRGDSPALIRRALAAKGVVEADVDAGLAAAAEDVSDPERTAALAYCRRRRIGPYRADDAAREANKQRDVAALARRGFAPDVVFDVLGADAEALDSGREAAW